MCCDIHENLPAASQAALEAAHNNKPYGKIITSTPGDMETDYGKIAFGYVDSAAQFIERIYDWDVDEVKEYIDRNSDNGFIRIRFNYRQIGRDEKWFYNQVKDLGKDWAKIRREVLLEYGNMLHVVVTLHENRFNCWKAKLETAC